MKKTIFFALLFLLCFSFAGAGTVTRSLSTSTVEPGGDLVVALAVVPDNESESFYAIDEIIPSGWTITNPGTGAIEQQGHIKWVVIQGAENANYSYTIAAPNFEGQASFSGKCLFEGGSEKEIAGVTTVAVAKAAPTLPPAPEPTPAPAIDSTLLAGALLIVIAIGIAGFLVSKKKKKK